MSYRTLLCAGAMVGLMAGTALSQAPRPQPDRPGFDRPMVANGELKEVLENYLEGSWDVQVKVWSAQDAQRHQPGIRPGERPGQQPGQRPGQQPGQQQTQQIEQQILQAMTRAGVERDQAQQQAQRLARQFTQQRPQEQQIRTQLEQAMTQAGVERQQAQQEAQRLAGQIHRMIDDQPGLQPRDNDTTFPTPDRPGERPRVSPGERPEYGEATLEAEGTSNRSWVLDDNILEEEAEFEMTSEAPVDRPGQQQLRHERHLQKLMDGETLQGHGMFGFDEENGHMFHVWADSSKGKIFYSVGEYDAQARTVTFYTAEPRELINGIRPEPRPGLRPGERPGQQPGAQPGQPRQPGHEPGAQVRQQPDRPGQQPGMRPGVRDRDDEQRARVVLRLIDEDEHVVEYYRSNPTGQAVRSMVITYTRNN